MIKMLFSSKKSREIFNVVSNYNSNNKKNVDFCVRDLLKVLFHAKVIKNHS